MMHWFKRSSHKSSDLDSPKVLGRSVDRLSILDGVIVATGWTDGDDPVVVLDGDPVPNQMCVRYPRPDLPNDRKFGFRIAVAMQQKPAENEKVAVQFEDGTLLRREPRRAEASVNLLGQFQEMMGQRQSPSLIEIGSRARSGTTYRHLFPADCRYVGMDIKEGPNVDVVTDAHTMAGVKEKFDFAFSVSVFEHLMMPWVAAQALNGVMNIGGVAYICSHPAWPPHEEPWDFFRFSKDSWKSLFNAFTGFEVIGTSYVLEAALVPVNMADGAIHSMDAHPIYLLSNCLVRKVAEPTVNWLVDPSKVYNLNYSHE